MRDIMVEVDQWLAAGRPVATATVARAEGSAPRPMGGKMACGPAGEIAGSVSGGCVEGAVYEAAQEVLRTGRPRLLAFGIADETAWQVGLACGGQLEVWLEALTPDRYDVVRRHVAERRPIAQATVVDGPGLGDAVLVWPDGRTRGGFASETMTARVAGYAAERLAVRTPGRLDVTVAGAPASVLVEVFVPEPRLVVVGAVHIAGPLVGFAKTLGLHTTVIDARAAFATRERFPHADELVVDWPARALAGLGLDAETYVVVLTHDDKVDMPALETALASPAGYIGILGSRSHQAQRVESLLERGVDARQLARLRGPVGLPVGAVGPDEIAVAIIAEIVAVRRGSPLATRPVPATG